MRALAIFTCISLVLCCADVHAKRHAKNEHLDATGGKNGDHQIIYITHTNSEIATRGTAIIVLRKSGKQESSYGYHIQEDNAKLGVIDEEKVVKLDKPEDPYTFITTVEVTPEQYPATQKIIKACNMKIPYISPYRPPNPTQFIGDIPAYSRDLVIGK